MGSGSGAGSGSCCGSCCCCCCCCSAGSGSAGGSWAPLTLWPDWAARAGWDRTASAWGGPEPWMLPPLSCNWFALMLMPSSSRSLPLTV